MIALSFYLARGQKSKKDYYLGGNSTGALPIAISTMATQCSTNSILGAPAFVAFSVGGGLIWLQYEIAVPLAMIFLMIFLLPIYRRLNIISVYAYLEKRYDPSTRLILSILFQFLRAFGTGVTVYGISLVLEYCMGIDYWVAVIILGVITIIYDSIGGMKAVIYSDVIQMILLYFGILYIIYLAIGLNGGVTETLNVFDTARMKAIDFSGTGFDGKTFAFLPMLFGGFFLYVSYYGCDQTQVQRNLSTKSVDDTNKSLFLNGVLRFPLVLTYCFLGVCIGAYAINHPDFINLLPIKNGSPEYNLSVPVFVMKYFPHGAIGLTMVALFSAAMSSLDSTINSLSATTMQDIMIGHFKMDLTEKQNFLWSKLLTVFWGTVCTIFSFFVGGMSDSIIVTINKIGSIANGPILAVFVMGVLSKKINAKGANLGLIIGCVFNAILWTTAPQVSWLWWNVIGFFVTYAIGYLVTFFSQIPEGFDFTGLIYEKSEVSNNDLKKWNKAYLFLFAYALFIIGVGVGIGG